MNCPPPVRFPLGRKPRWSGVIAGVWLLALMPFLSALALHEPAQSSMGVSVIVLAAFLLGAGLTWRLRRGPVWNALVWNGAQWFLENTRKDGATTVIAPPAIRFDGQRWLLLRTGTGRRAIWLWLGRSAAPARWHALRCALYAHVPAPLAPA